ncbi:MAG: hypothetical protein M1533_05760 [Candidatus Thermoplasmatota archaeon]|jgi:hypothetical protein|nr:hypothetical protein [Candidatus Thermoplasmatota archaeon]MCL5794681.1 hypothetical protein [Candidatus Thermoplasmatota archaeon]
MASSRSNDRIDRIIYEKRKSASLGSIPDILIPVWQIKLKERFGINVDREIASYVVLAAHEQGTWKRYRAVKRIEKILRERGEDPATAHKLASEIVIISMGPGQ